MTQLAVGGASHWRTSSAPTVAACVGAMRWAVASAPPPPRRPSRSSRQTIFHRINDEALCVYGDGLRGRLAVVAGCARRRVRRIVRLRRALRGLAVVVFAYGAVAPVLTLLGLLCSGRPNLGNKPRATGLVAIGLGRFLSVAGSDWGAVTWDRVSAAHRAASARVVGDVRALRDGGVDGRAPRQQGVLEPKIVPAFWWSASFWRPVRRGLYGLGSDMLSAVKTEDILGPRGGDGQQRGKRACVSDGAVRRGARTSTRPAASVASLPALAATATAAVVISTPSSGQLKQSRTCT